MGEQVGESRSVDAEPAPTELDAEAVRQLRRSGPQSGGFSPAHGRHEAAEDDFGPAGHDVPMGRLPEPGPITADPDPVEQSGRGALILIVILAVIGVLLVGAIIAQFAGAFG